MKINSKSTENDFSCFFFLGFFQVSILRTRECKDVRTEKESKPTKSKGHYYLITTDLRF